MAVYVDRLTSQTFWRLLLKGPCEVEYLKPLSKLGNSLRTLLCLFGYKVVETEFFLGDIDRQSEDHSIYEVGFRHNVELASLMAREIVSSGYMSSINEKFGSNTVQLFLAKCIQIELNVAHRFGEQLELCHRFNSPDILIEKPPCVSQQVLKDWDNAKHVVLYESPLRTLFSKIQCLQFLGRMFVRSLVLRFLGAYTKKTDLFSKDESTTIVFSIIEDSIGESSRHRRQDFWLSENTSDLNYYVLIPNNFKGLVGQSGTAPNVRCLHYGDLGYALRKLGRHKIFSKHKSSIRRLLLELFLGKDSSYVSACKNVINLFGKSIEIGSLAGWINADHFLFKEAHNQYSDAIQLVAESLGVKANALQYSVPCIPNHLMYTTADRYLVFSDQFQPFLSTSEFKPGSFEVLGYLYKQAVFDVKEIGSVMKQKFNALGVKLIVGYFDESIEEHKFGLVSRDHHLEDIRLLARKVLEHPELAVVLKPQFSRNSVSIIYKDDPTINLALGTGRLLEVSEGNIRNNVMPIQIGVVADICVGNNFGGTALMEAAIAGSRGIFLNDYNVKGERPFDLPKSLTVKNLDEFFKKITLDNNELKLPAGFGNLQKILNFIDPFDDHNSYQRIEQSFIQRVDAVSVE